MRKKFLKIGILAVAFFLTIFVFIDQANAGLIKNNVKDGIGVDVGIVGERAGYDLGNDDSALILVQTIINIFLSIIGVLLLVYILYAGYNWLTAQGEEDKVTKAKDTIRRAIMGAIIIIAAYAISMFVMSRLEKGTLKGASAGRTISYLVIPASEPESRNMS